MKPEGAWWVRYCGELELAEIDKDGYVWTAGHDEPTSLEHVELVQRIPRPNEQDAGLSDEDLERAQDLIGELVEKEFQKLVGFVPRLTLYGEIIIRTNETGKMNVIPHIRKP